MAAAGCRGIEHKAGCIQTGHGKDRMNLRRTQGVYVFRGLTPRTLSWLGFVARIRNRGRMGFAHYVRPCHSAPAPSLRDEALILSRAVADAGEG